MKYIKRLINKIFFPQGTWFGSRCSGFKCYPNGKLCGGCSDCENIVDLPIHFHVDKVEFIVRCRFLAWCCYQLAAGQNYNLTPTEDQLKSLKNGVKFGLQNPNATPEENHNNWMKMKISQGWVYGEEKNMEKKTHFDLVPFNELLKVEKDKDIMDCEMNREFAKLWDLMYPNYV
jgi:hypothetical protein